MLSSSTYPTTRYSVPAVLMLALLAAVGTTRGQVAPRPVVITGVTVIDATGSPARPNMSVVITGERITDIGAAGRVKIPRKAHVINAKGKFLIPGLWDMHAHVDDLGEVGLALFIANGVTGIREMGGGDFARLSSWRAQIEAGKVIGPRIKLSGPILESTRFIQMLEQFEKRSFA